MDVYCRFPKCTKKIFCRGLCASHYGNKEIREKHATPRLRAAPGTSNARQHRPATDNGGQRRRDGGVREVAATIDELIESRIQAHEARQGAESEQWAALAKRLRELVIRSQHQVQQLKAKLEQRELDAGAAEAQRELKAEAKPE